MPKRLPFKWHPGVAELLVLHDAVKPHPMNPNNGDVDAVRESVVRNGVYRAVVAQRKTGYILAGHTTYDAIVGLQYDAGIDAPEVPVTWVDCDAKTAERIVAVDNRSAQLARMDDALLVQLLQDLDGDLLGTGYDADDLDALMAKLDGDSGEAGNAEPGLDEGELSIIVTCTSEQQQSQLLERFEEEGLICRPLMM